MEIHKLLCPIDFSPSSREAMVEAIELAGRRGAALTLFHVIAPVAVSSPEAMVVPTYDAALQRETDQELEAWRAEARGLGAERVETKRVVGTPWDAIVTAAREGSFDLIVMSTHGRTGLAHVFIGSVAERVVRHAPCPVLVLRPVQP
jgi:nucleotide-binding universal stress UspA family protein